MLLWWLSGKETACQCRRFKFDPWVGKIPWRRNGYPLQYSCLGQFHRQRSLEDYSPWDHKELDTTKQLRHNNTVALYPKLPSRSEKTSHKVGDSVCHTNQLRKEENPRVDGCYPYASARKICDPKDDQTKTRFSGEET